MQLLSTSHVHTVTSLFQRLSLVLLTYCTKVYFYACLYKIVERENVIEKNHACTDRFCK